MESLPYRVAGTLLLLYAQPLMKIVALPAAAIVISPLETRISLGAEPVPVPEPFADMLKHHLRTLGINLLGARNSGLQNLVAEIPLP